MRDGIRRVQATLSERPEAFSMLVFHVELLDVFTSPPVDVFLVGDPTVCNDHPLYGEALIPKGPSLLPRDRDFPIGRHDFMGIDTTPEAATVIDAVSVALRDAWLTCPCPALSHVEVLAGWLDFGDSSDDPVRGTLLDFATGAMREVELPDD
jgi:hypothetical protein